jgi:hypothetical protein
MYFFSPLLSSMSPFHTSMPVDPFKATTQNDVFNELFLKNNRCNAFNIGLHLPHIKVINKMRR